MKKLRTQNQARTAFTLVELLALIAIVGLLASLTIPAFARAKIKSPAAGCLSGMRQLMVGWEMYKEDNNDSLMPNSAAGMVDSASWVSSRAESWTAVDVNTNTHYLLDSLMAPYVNNDVRPYRCPADVIPSANGIRLRSRSMNGQMGYSPANYNTGWTQYLKGSQLTCPLPANAWIFCDESMWSLNDGYLELDLTKPSYPDTPANYHGSACGFSFADGHAEDHRWVMRGIPGSGLGSGMFLAGVPQQRDVSRSGATSWGSSVQDADYIWLRQHSSCNHR